MEDIAENRISKEESKTLIVPCSPQKGTTFPLDVLSDGLK